MPAATQHQAGSTGARPAGHGTPPTRHPLARWWVPVLALTILAGAAAVGQHLRNQRMLAADRAAQGTRELADARRDAHAALDDDLPATAFDMYTSLLARDPDDAQSLAHLGWTIALMGNRGTGVRLVEQSLALVDDPETRWMRTRLAGAAPATPAAPSRLRDHLRSHAAQLAAATTTGPTAVTEVP